MNNLKLQYSNLKKKYLSFLKKQEVMGEPFYDKMGQFQNFYLPICKLIHKKFIQRKNKNESLIVGLSGGQGSGKTTIAQILKIILKDYYKIGCNSFSIDDYYKTLKERKKMVKNNSRLFLTRGVPGTHDTKMLYRDIKKLKKNNFRTIMIPCFDKAIDDRLPKRYWKKFKRNQNIIIFEGWCVGAKAQKSNDLKRPVNELEKKYDQDLSWRKKVNNELKKNYSKIFKMIDTMIYLKVPNFSYVHKWRLLQEKKLAIKSKGKKIMNKQQIKTFIMHYERVTKTMLKDLLFSDVKISLDKKHRLKSIKFN